MNCRGLIEVSNLSKTYTISYSFHNKRSVEAVKGVSFCIGQGETLALIGESGSGKSTVGRIILGLLEPSSGEVRWRGEPVSAFRGNKLREYRKAVQAVFQDPHSSLSPRMRIGDIISEPLRNFGYQGDFRQRVVELLETVGLDPMFERRFPYQCSGGQKQRVAIARALAGEPEAIILDEPLSALDVSVQAQIITLLNELKRRLGVSYLLITHDLRVLGAAADRVAVMYRGEIVEISDRDQFTRNPSHDYSKSLLSALPPSVWNNSQGQKKTVQ